jgi:hypothetical protein
MSYRLARLYDTLRGVHRLARIPQSFVDASEPGVWPGGRHDTRNMSGSFLSALIVPSHDVSGIVDHHDIESNDVDLISMSPWRGTPIVTPEVFRQKVDGMRRHARRRR